MKQAALSFAGRASNPTKASPAQLAARKRFAEMARSGAFKKATKRKANPEPTHDFAKIGKPFEYDGRTWKVSKYAHTGKTIEAYTTDRKKPYRVERLDVAMLMLPRRKINPATIQYIVFSELSPQKYKQMLVTENKQRAISVANVNQMDGYHSVVEDQVGHLIYDAKTRQGYLQSNPMQKYTVLHRGTANVAGEVIASGPQAAKQKVAEKLGIPTLAYLVAKKTNPAKKTVSQKVSQLVNEGYPQRQAVAVALSEQRAGKVKRNPAKVKYRNLATNLKGDQRVGYSVHMADRPSYHAIAWFSKKADAMEVAQEAADRTGKQLAVTRVQNYFGAM